MLGVTDLPYYTVMVCVNNDWKKLGMLVMGRQSASKLTPKSLNRSPLTAQVPQLEACRLTSSTSLSLLGSFRASHVLGLPKNRWLWRAELLGWNTRGTLTRTKPLDHAHGDELSDFCFTTSLPTYLYKRRSIHCALTQT